MHPVNQEEYQNALKQHTLSLRGCSLQSCDAMVHASDMYDCVDLSDNDIEQVDFDVFAPHNRIKSILLSKNRLTYIRNTNGKISSSLTTLTLSYNAIKELESLDFIKFLPKLTYISLVGNPVTKLPEYRETIISLLPSIRFIDFQRVTEHERKKALQPSTSNTLSEKGEERRLELLRLLEQAANLEEIEKIEQELSALK